jgi:hypothetical protein
MFGKDGDALGLSRGADQSCDKIDKNLSEDADVRLWASLRVIAPSVFNG